MIVTPLTTSTTWARETTRREGLVAQVEESEIERRTARNLSLASRMGPSPFEKFLSTRVTLDDD